MSCGLRIIIDSLDDTVRTKVSKALVKELNARFPKRETMLIDLYQQDHSLIDKGVYATLSNDSKYLADLFMLNEQIDKSTGSDPCYNVVVSGLITKNLHVNLPRQVEDYMVVISQKISATQHFYIDVNPDTYAKPLVEQGRSAEYIERTKFKFNDSRMKILNTFLRDEDKVVLDDDLPVEAIIDSIIKSINENCTNLV